MFGLTLEASSLMLDQVVNWELRQMFLILHCWFHLLLHFSFCINERAWIKRFQAFICQQIYLNFFYQICVSEISASVLGRNIEASSLMLDPAVCWGTC